MIVAGRRLQTQSSVLSVHTSTTTNLGNHIEYNVPLFATLDEVLGNTGVSRSPIVMQSGFSVICPCFLFEREPHRCTSHGGIRRTGGTCFHLGSNSHCLNPVGPVLQGLRVRRVPGGALGQTFLILLEVFSVLSYQQDLLFSNPFIVSFNLFTHSFP